MVIKKSTNTVRDLVSDYLEAVKSGRATSKRNKQGSIPKAATVSQYKCILEDVFLPWADSAGFTDTTDITEAALDRFTKHLQTKPGARGRRLSAVSVKTYARGVNLMLGWANRRGDIAGVRVVTDEPKQAEFDLLTRSEIAAMVKVADSPRDRLIVRALRDTGCRLGELLNLTIGDVKREDGHHYLRLRGKGGRNRTAGIERDLYRDLIAYINGGRKGPAGDDAPLWMSERRSGDGYKALTASGVEQMIAHLGEDAGIKKRVYPHLLRHGYATEALNNGMPETVLMRVLGHNSLAMISKVYLHLADEDVQRAMLQHLEKVRQ